MRQHLCTYLTAAVYHPRIPAFLFLPLLTSLNLKSGRNRFLPEEMQPYLLSVMINKMYRAAQIADAISPHCHQYTLATDKQTDEQADGHGSCIKTLLCDVGLTTRTSVNAILLFP